MVDFRSSSDRSLFFSDVHFFLLLSLPLSVLCGIRQYNSALVGFTLWYSTLTLTKKANKTQQIRRQSSILRNSKHNHAVSQREMKRLNSAHTYSPLLFTSVFRLPKRSVHTPILASEDTGVAVLSWFPRQPADPDRDRGWGSKPLMAWEGQTRRRNYATIGRRHNATGACFGRQGCEDGRNPRPPKPRTTKQSSRWFQRSKGWSMKVYNKY